MQRIKVNYVRKGGKAGKGFMVETPGGRIAHGGTREFVSPFSVGYGDILNVEMKDGIAQVKSVYKPRAHDMHKE